MYKVYMKMLGERIKLQRIYSDLSQDDLVIKSGVSKRTISRLEQGHSVQADSLIRILCALDLEENLKLLVPDQTKRPSMYLKVDKKQKIMQRVSKKATPSSKFKWGDEK